MVTLSAAVARQYPFSDRPILFLVPMAIMAIAEASAAAAQFAERFSKPLAGLAVLGVSFLAMLPVARTLPPYRVEDVKSVLRHIETRRQPGDEVYVYYGAAAVMSVYDAALRPQYTRPTCRCRVWIFTVTGPHGANQQNTCVSSPHTMIRSNYECTGPPNPRCTRRPNVDSLTAGERWPSAE
jgi:hypothetical protein